MRMARRNEFVIKGGSVVNREGVTRVDVKVKDGVVTEVGSNVTKFKVGQRVRVRVASTSISATRTVRCGRF